MKRAPLPRRLVRMIKRSKLARINCAWAPVGTSPAKVIDWAVSSIERMVRTTER